MQELRDRTAVITGAASGIGRATAEKLAAAGTHLALCDLDEANLQATARSVEGSGRRVSTHRVDVSDRARMEALAEEVQRTHGAVHLLVNNAGVTVTSTFEDHSIGDFEWLFGINFWGVVYGCKFFLPALKRAGEGHIVNVSSVFGLVGVPLQSSYCSSKFAVRGFSESLRVELAPQGIVVTSVHPGGVATNIARSARYAGDDAEMSRLRAGVVELFETKMLPPAEAAERIVRGIRKNSARVLITREAYLIDALSRSAPWLAGQLVSRAWSRMRRAR